MPNRLFSIHNTLSTQNNILSGITFRNWAWIVCRNVRNIDFATFFPRLVFVTLMSLFNSLMAAIEWVLHEREIRLVRLNDRPVFVLGHPRTGTTHCFNLLSLDERFAYPTTFMCGFPSYFLWFERFGKALLAGVISKTRPMDNMALSFDTPQEDELATNVLSAGASPYMPLVFMRHEREYRQYLALKDEDMTDPAGKARWVSSFTYILRKITLYYQRARHSTSPHRLLLKSPVHTSRIALLLQLFPNAQFIYMHRHPERVLQSAMNMAQKTYWFSYLEVPSDDDIIEFIVSQFENMHREYVATRGLVPPGNLIEVGFDELDSRPLETLERIYTHLGWAGEYARMKPRFESYLATDAKDFQKNSFNDKLDAHLLASIKSRWKDAYEEFGYKQNADV